jgi:hypothetical protein
MGSSFLARFISLLQQETLMNEQNRLIGAARKSKRMHKPEPLAAKYHLS